MPMRSRLWAAVKHFFDYDLEGHKETDRQNIDVNVSARDQTEYFLPSFKAAVQRGRSHSLMCSYTAVNGEVRTHLVVWST